jgi:hypothetical protein
MKTKRQQRMEAEKAGEAQAAIDALARQQAFIDHRSADPQSILFSGDPARQKAAFEQLLWPYNVQRRLPAYEEMSKPYYRETILAVEKDKLRVLMDYIEINPDAGVDIEVLGNSITIAGYDAYGDREQFYKIRDGSEIVFFRTCQGTNSIVPASFFIEAASDLREEANRIEDWV